MATTPQPDQAVGADERPTVTTRGTVVIDLEACKGCLLCIDACPPGVLKMTTLELNERGYRYPVLLPGCTGCRACSQICPDFVFQVYKFDQPMQLPAPLPPKAPEEEA
jgi:2-oxoglutarate ferredoxin oxidoreductase subunit delta